MEAPGPPIPPDTCDSDESPSGRGGHTAALVREQNAALQAIPISAIRQHELPTELNQFFAATLANRARLDFDTEPADFAAALARHAGGNA